MRGRLLRSPAASERRQPVSAVAFSTGAGQGWENSSVDFFPKTRQADGEEEASSQAFGLPLVSVIIINHNYGRFLKEAAGSVFEQTYPHVECIIVDNASTDESPGVLHEISKRHPDTQILRRNENGGQNVAALEGFEASRGEYIVFLDADDVLFPSFVETHVLVLLSLRIPVGFSSADMVQSVDRRMVVGTIAGLSDYVRSGRGRKPDLLRRIDEAAPNAWPLGKAYGSLDQQVHFVPPGIPGWYWAPMSGNCFRRDALQLFMNNGSLSERRNCLDAYLIRGVSVLMGSVVLDRPLAAYRLHGKNVFSKHPPLNCVLNYERGLEDNDQTGRKMVIDHLMAKAEFFLRKLENSQIYMRALKALDRAWPRLPATVRGAGTYVSGKLVAEPARFVRELGFFTYVLLLVRLRLRLP